MSAATSVPPAHSAQLPACGSLILPVGTVTPTAGVVGTLPALEAVGWKPARRLGCAAQRVLLRMAPRRAHLWGASPVRVPGGRRGDPSCLRGGAGVHAHQRIGGGFLVASGMNSRHQDHASRALTPHLGVSVICHRGRLAQCPVGPLSFSSALTNCPRGCPPPGPARHMWMGHTDSVLFDFRKTKANFNG